LTFYERNYSWDISSGAGPVERPPWKGIYHFERPYDSRYRLIIQSERTPDVLEEKIEIFLDLLRENIVEMSPEDYQSHVSSLVLSLSETPKYLGKETFRYWNHIESGFYEFSKRISPFLYLLIYFRRDGHCKCPKDFQGGIVVLLQ
jgi:hypothetical protein